MEDFAYMYGLVADWVTGNPVLAGAAVVGVVVLRWLLNRRTALERESARVVNDLTDTNKGKYNDLRPMN